MGDTNLFMAILNGIAMIFGGSDLYSGNGAFGLGFGAFFGATILMTIMVYNAAFKKQLDFRLLITPLILYFVMTAPKVDVAIQDIYGSEAVKRVDNIPLGLALPLSAASGISYIITTTFETGYSVISGHQDMMPRLTDSGYVTPLKLINALRTASTQEGSSSLFQTTKNFYTNCINNNPNFNAEAYSKSVNPLQYLTTVTQTSSGLVSIVQAGTSQDNPQSLVTCNQAATIISKTLDSIMDGVKNPQDQYNIVGDVSKYNLGTLINGEMISNGGASGSGPKANEESRAAGLNGYRYEDVTSAFASITSLSESQARDFIAASLFNPYMQSAAYCADTRSANDMTGLSRCTAWVSSVNQWEEKNAASATGFLKTLQNGQNILIMFAIGIFPIVVILIMFQGVSSFKTVVDYIVFMISTLLWIPVASIFNFYTQFNLMEEYANVVNSMGGAGLSLFTASQFYGAVAQKLSIANGLLALTPILCMLIFKGMSMATSYAAGKLNSAEGGNYDAKVNNPDIQKSAPISTTNSVLTASGQNVITENGKMQTSISGSTTYSSSQQVSQEYANNYAESDSKWNSLGNNVAGVLSKGRNESSATVNSTTASEGETLNASKVETTGTENNTSSGTGSTASVGNASAETTNNSNADITSGGFNASLGALKNPNSGNAKGNNPAEKQAAVLGTAGAQVGGGKQYINTDSKGNTQNINVNDAESANYVDNTGVKTAINESTASGVSKAFNTIKSTEDRIEFLERAEIKNMFSADSGLKQQYDETLSSLRKTANSQQVAYSMAMNNGGEIGNIVGSIKTDQGGLNALKSAINKSYDQDNINAAKENFIKGGLIKGQDAEIGGIVFGAMTSSDKDVQRSLSNLINPSATREMDKINKEVGDSSDIARVEKQNFGPINTKGLNPQNANQVQNIGVPPTNPNTLKVGGATIPSGPPQNNTVPVQAKPLFKGSPSKVVKDEGRNVANSVKEAITKK